MKRLRVLFLLAVIMPVQAAGLEKKSNLLTSKGEEGLLEDVTEKMKNEPNLDEELSRTSRTADDPYTLQKLSPTLDALDLAIPNNFPTNTEEIKRPQKWLAKMKENWNSKPYTERQARATALISAASNIPALANAKDNPVGAIQGVLNIMASVSQVAGPTGQLVSIGFMFVSSLLGLFGLGNKSKPIGEIVREQIDDALVEFHDQLISNEAIGAVIMFGAAKAFVDGASKNNKKLRNDEVCTITSNVPAVQDLLIMGKLAANIEQLKKNNNPSDAKKCFKYIELYLQLTTLKNMIIFQTIGLIPKTFPNTINAYLGALQFLQDLTKKMIQFLHDPNKESKLMPYFDGESYPTTTEYMRNVVNIKRPNLFPGPDYCISAFQKGKKYLGKFYETFVSPPMSHPLAQVSNTAYCKWRLVPHGNNLFSITSEDGMLSYDNGDVTVASIEKEDPVMWKIWSAGGSRYWIKVKYFCGAGNRCNYGLRYKWYKKYHAYSRTSGSRTIPFRVGYLHPVSNRMIPWVIYKKPSDMTAEDNEGSSSGNEEDGSGEEQDLQRETGTSGHKAAEGEKNHEISFEEILDYDKDIKILTTEGQRDWFSKVLKRVKELQKQLQNKGVRKKEIHKNKKRPGISQE